MNTPLTTTVLLLVILGSSLMAGCANDSHSGDALPIETDPEPPVETQFTDDPSVPQTCDEVAQIAAEGKATTVGCEFFAHSLDVIESSFEFAIVLANVNYRKDAHFTIYGITWDESTEAFTWQELESGRVQPLERRRAPGLNDVAGRGREIGRYPFRARLRRIQPHSHCLTSIPITSVC